MGDRRLSPRYFDNTQTLVSTRYGPVAGVYLKPGQALPDDLDYRTRLSMWMSRRAVYQDNFTPTPHAEGSPDAEDAWMNLDRGYAVTELGGGWYAIKSATAAEDDEGEKVQGADDAQGRAEDLRQAHENKGVLITAGKGGWHIVTAPWLAEPVKAQGADKAGAARDKLALAGPPEGWQASDGPLTEDQIANWIKPVGETDALVVISIDGETYTVSAPWLNQPETFDDPEAADNRQAELRAEGPPEGWKPVAPEAGDDPVTVEPGEGEREGKFVVSAPWLDEPELLDTDEAAQERATAIRTAGPPEGWTPPLAPAPAQLAAEQTGHQDAAKGLGDTDASIGEHDHDKGEAAAEGETAAEE